MVFLLIPGGGVHWHRSALVFGFMLSGPGGARMSRKRPGLDGEKAGFIGGTGSTPLARWPAITVECVDQQGGSRADIRGFLVSRRAKVTPDQARLPPGSRRPVP